MDAAERNRDWRKRNKDRIILAMGGSCCVCNYNKCTWALALHHLDPSEKEFNIGDMLTNFNSWERIVAELRKCILVCHNCHSEIHAGETLVPIDAARYNEYYSSALEQEAEKRTRPLTPCKVCGILKKPWLKSCSVECFRKSTQRINWDLVDISKELETKSVLLLASELGVSDAAIHKRMKKLGIKNPRSKPRK
jgi:hypothetical protein